MLENKTEKDKITFCDKIFNFMLADKNILDKSQIEKIRKFMIEEEFESDTIKSDISIYGNRHQSNFYVEFSDHDNLKLYLSIKRFLTQYQC